MAEKLLIEHVISVLHHAMPPALRFDFDWRTQVSWHVFRGHILGAKANLAALAVHGPGGGAGGVAAVAGGGASLLRSFAYPRREFTYGVDQFPLGNRRGQFRRF